METKNMKSVTLNNGIRMPMNGFGLYQITDPEQCEQALLDAIGYGCRMIDTAASYGNEKVAGKVIEECGILRRELFITTKLSVQDAGYQGAKRAFESSMEKLGLEYLDLYMIQQPFGDYYGAYKALEELYWEGRIRAIGVCNFEADRLMDLCLHAEVLPAVAQMEIHPFLQQKKARDVMKLFDICPQGWVPLEEGKQTLFRNPVLNVIGEKYGKTAEQVALRWNIQQGVSIIQKALHLCAIKQHLELWDFSLGKEDLEAIRALETGCSEILNVRSPEFIKQICEQKIHD